MDQGQETRATALFVTGAVRRSCEALGTTAWVVLIDVALDAEVHAKGRLVADTNVRRIAAHLGISKDSAARALARLADAGLVVRRGTRRGVGGRFAPSGYELRLDPDGGIARVSSSPRPMSPRPASENGAIAPSSASPSPGLEDGRFGVAASSPRGSPRKPRVDQEPLFDLAGESSRRP